MNYDLEAQEGKIYPHSRAIYLFDVRVHFKWTMSFTLQTPAHAGTIPFLWKEYSQTNTLSKYSRVE
jgi:hypothetical protein